MKFSVLSCQLSVLCFLCGLCVAQTTQPSIRPDTRLEVTPAERYALAGQARRDAGVETWFFVHATWLKWYGTEEKYASPHARELIDGFALVLVPGRVDADIVDGLQAKLRLCELRCPTKILPGMRLGPDKSYDEWARPETWRADLDYWRQVEAAFDLPADAPRLADAEPYWDGKRYPRQEDMYAVAEAMEVWRDEIGKRDLWIGPAHPDLWNTWLLASWAVRAGRQVWMMDQGTYSRCGGDDAALEEMIRQRKALLESLGMHYMPGFYLEHAIDPHLYELLNRCGVKRCWFFGRAGTDHQNEFGSLKWEHAQQGASE